MDIIKKSLFVLVLLLVVVLAWIGFSVYFQSSFVDVNPNASSYTDQLKTSFDTEELEEINKRTEDSLPVSPQDFLSLIGEN
jgi:predicted negative regulator of RcsB-dependent stress response